MDETQLNNPIEHPTETFHAGSINKTRKSGEFETQVNGGRIGVIRIIGPNFVAYCKTMEEFKVFTDKHVRDSFNSANERGFVHDGGFKVDIVMLPVRVAFTLKPFTG